LYRKCVFNAIEICAENSQHNPLNSI
jgi:hypothetical protein